MRLNGTRTGAARGVAAGAALCVLLVACQRVPPRPAERPTAVPSELGETLPADARLFEVAPEASFVSILVYRAGALASAGHNHVVASHDVHGQVAVTPDLTRSRFRLRMPVATLTVDEPEARRAAGEAFAGELPGSAREATRRNMLGAAVLDAARFAEVLVVAERIEPAPGGALASVRITLRGVTRTLPLPVRFEQKGGELLADGELRLLQSAFGITPFSALLGAIRVQDEITVRFRILARAVPRQARQAGCPRDTPCSAPPA